MDGSSASPIRRSPDVPQQISFLLLHANHTMKILKSSTSPPSDAVGRSSAKHTPRPIRCMDYAQRWQGCPYRLTVVNPEDQPAITFAHAPNGHFRPGSSFGCKVLWSAPTRYDFAPRFGHKTRNFEAPLPQVMGHCYPCIPLGVASCRDPLQPPQCLVGLSGYTQYGIRNFCTSSPRHENINMNVEPRGTRNTEGLYSGSSPRTCIPHNYTHLQPPLEHGHPTACMHDMTWRT